jgi:molybdenum cofactor sulfurtransferase
LTSNLYGNPHSESPASWLATKRVEEARLAVLGYFKANPDDFDVVFTANATAAIKLVSDCFRDQSFWYGYHKDCHNSLVGVREVATAGSRCFTSSAEVEEWIEQGPSLSSPGLKLFAYPAQSNMTGYRPPYHWCRQVADRDSQQSTFVLLDAASYLTSARLDLSNADQAPDFVAMSFYKIFGYPDLGALLVKKTARSTLAQRKYFAGGTVDMVTVIGGDFHAFKRSNIHDFLEDGTVPFHNIVALKHAISLHARLFGSGNNISMHTAYLSKLGYDELSQLRHANGQSVIEVHKDPQATYGDPTTQGPIIAFSVKHSDGTVLGRSHFEELAIECGLQLRTGGVCNPGGIASMLQLKKWELRRNFEEGARCGDGFDTIGAKPTGIIRISLGPMSTQGDVIRFAEFVKMFFVDKGVQSPPSSPLASTSISPVEGCPVLPVHPSEQAAYQVWDRRWCVIEEKSGSPIKDIEHLKAEIDVHTEELILSRVESRLALSLWDVPEAPDKQLSTPAKRIYDIYDNPAANTWLSEQLGFPCVLAHYRLEDPALSPEATTCAVVWCAQKCADKDELRDHYKSHAQVFMDARPFITTGNVARPHRDGSRCIRFKDLFKRTGTRSSTRTIVAWAEKQMPTPVERLSGQNTSQVSLPSVFAKVHFWKIPQVTVTSVGHVH